MEETKVSYAQLAYENGQYGHAVMTKREYFAAAALQGIPSMVNPCKDIEVVEHLLPRAAKPKGCPKCGHAGNFVRMALCCPDHGAFGGC